MKLSTFILDEMDQILACWDEHAATMTPAADEMSLLALRDHCEEMLRAVAADIETPQTEREQIEKSKGESPDESADSAASEHGTLRHAFNFTLVQLSSEFRALRASVLRLWLQQVERVTPDVLDDVIRFNEGIDQALSESIVTYAERESNSRDLFDAILGHDLRGPLSAITLAGELLMADELPPEKARALGGRIKSSSLYMSSMVADTLEFARIRLGNAPLPVEQEMVNVESACASAVADAAAMHPHSRFELQVEGNPQSWMDANRMRQLLMNLLGNAGQHGARDRPIQLFVSVDDVRTVFRVVNEGPDIAPEYLETIFEPLVRGKIDETPGAHRATSLGLGLHIAREIAHSHGGTLTVESRDRVTSFTVSIPARPALGD